MNWILLFVVMSLFTTLDETVSYGLGCVHGCSATLGASNAFSNLYRTLAKQS